MYTSLSVLAFYGHVEHNKGVQFFAMELNGGYVGLAIICLYFAIWPFFGVAKELGWFRATKEVIPSQEISPGIEPGGDHSPISRDDAFKRNLEETFAHSPSQASDDWRPLPGG